MAPIEPKNPAFEAPLSVRGRIVKITASQVAIQSLAGVHECSLPPGSPTPHLGDIVTLKCDSLQVLTPYRGPKAQAPAEDRSPSANSPQFAFTSRVLNPRRQKALAVRRRVESGISRYFESRDFFPVRTPTLVKSPGMETHIRPYRLVTGEFIPTSPEFAMKKLLVGGLERIFQICPAFRSEPCSPHHHPEFSILEWYRAYAGYEEIMADFEGLVESLALEINGTTELNYQGRKISLKTPWPRLRVRDLFIELAQVDLVAASTPELLAREVRRLGLTADPGDTWDDLYFRIWLNFIEPKLPADRAVFVIRYPASQSALSVIDQDPDGSRWARRFEPYAGGLELGNAFEELTDPVEQRKRFVEDMELRAQLYGPSFPVNPIDEEFIAALEEGMPPSGGIAVGVDRLVMLLADEPDIDYTIWLPSYVESGSR